MKAILIGIALCVFFVLGFARGYEYGRERGIEEEQIRHIREEI